MVGSVKRASGQATPSKRATHSLRRHRSDSEVVEFVQSPFRVSMSRPISRATIYHALSSKPAVQPYFSSLRHLGLLRPPIGRHCKQQYLSVTRGRHVAQFTFMLILNCFNELIYTSTLNVAILFLFMLYILL